MHAGRWVELWVCKCIYYTILHVIPLHYAALHYIALHYITLQ